MSEQHPEKQIRVAIFPTDALPHIKTIDHTLAALQGIVGGLIEVFPTKLPGVVGICDDEFLFHGEPFNILSLPFGAQICGTFILCADVCGPEGREFASLTDAQCRMIECGPCWPTPKEREDAARGA